MNESISIVAAPRCYQNERRHAARGEATGAATMSIQRHSIVTPEAVAVRVDIAELGSRVGAGLIDGLILRGGLTGIQIPVGPAGTIGILGLGGGLAAALSVAFLLLVAFADHPFF